ncbi:peptidase M35 [Pyxidicoccus parkwayensis]|uniref:Peptidase M35 n=1 Tax=Pyxidicoccus parkwayensis TaxID=2813578 RepID=A0ABX7PA96_9BACT|nr:M35 family metallo-endopeptidase [Pyxidicoccus parkwaysis]QSQ27400.1 peptidase M35 [Pyxidicoccus parkwaysis]
MSKRLGVSSRWLAGWLVSASLLGACAPEEQVPAGETPVAAPESAEARDISVSLSVPKASLSAREDVLVSVTLRNDGKSAARLLKWNTPADDVEEALFDVTVDGQAVAFTGPHYKRPAPQDSDYLTLAPGETLTRTVALSNFYDLSRTGTYHVSYAAQVHGSVTAFASNSVDLWVEGRVAREAAAAPGGVTTLGAISFSGRCDATQQSTILQALNTASSMANNASSYLAGTPSGTPRYTTWFGAFSSSGWSTAKSHFVAIKDAFDTKPITVDCSCKKTYYAYVYPTQPYTIYVCKAFWSAPLSGTDSKGGTLIHEMSHFNVVAGTDDHVYGQSGAKSLAISNPAQALDNADNHEYFAENTPFQN